MFKRVGKRIPKRNEFVPTSFRLAFGEKAFCDRVLKPKLAAHGAIIKKDFTINMSYVVAIPVAPFIVLSLSVSKAGRTYRFPLGNMSQLPSMVA